MTVPKPFAALTMSLAVLALGLAVLFFAQAQYDVWSAFGASTSIRPAWAKAAEIGFLFVTGAVTTGTPAPPGFPGTCAPAGFAASPAAPGFAPAAGVAWV